MKKIMFLFFAVSILNSCSLPRHINFNVEDDVLIAKGYGLAVFSFTISGIADVPFNIAYRNLNEYGLINFSFFSSLYSGDAININEPVSGKLYFFKIPEGRYEFYNLYIEESYEQAFWSSSGKYSIPFEVEENKILYIGNLHVDSVNLGNDVFNIKSTSFFKDEFSRDMALIKQYFSNAKNIEVVKSSYLSSEENVAIQRIHVGTEVVPRR